MPRAAGTRFSHNSHVSPTMRHHERKGGLLDRSRGGGGHTQAESPVEALSTRFGQIVRVNSAGGPGHGFAFPGHDSDPVSLEPASEEDEDHQQETQQSLSDSKNPSREQGDSLQHVLDELDAHKKRLQEGLALNAALVLHVNDTAKKIHDLTEENKELGVRNAILGHLVLHLIGNDTDAMKRFEALIPSIAK